MYEPKDSQVRGRQLKVQRLVVPVVINADGTPEDKTFDIDEPSLVFLKTQGKDDITVASGAVDTQAELDAITFMASDDMNGDFSILIRINEPVVKVMSVKGADNANFGIYGGTFPTGATSGITSLGDKIVVDMSSGVDLSTDSIDMALEVEYVVEV